MKVLYIQQSVNKAPAIDTKEFLSAIASITGAIFEKAKIYKIFVDFCFAKIVNYFLFFKFYTIIQQKLKKVNYFGKAKIYKYFIDFCFVKNGTSYRCNSTKKFFCINSWFFIGCLLDPL